MDPVLHIDGEPPIVWEPLLWNDRMSAPSHTKSKNLHVNEHARKLSGKKA